MEKRMQGSIKSVVNALMRSDADSAPKPRQKGIKKHYLLQYLKPNSNYQSSLYPWLHQLSPAWTILYLLWQHCSLSFTSRHHRCLAHKCSSLNVSILLIRNISFWLEGEKRSTS